MNPVVVAVSLMLVLSLLRINVVVSLSISAIVGGLLGGLSLADTLSTFSGGLGGGAEIALSYAMLGAFAVAISRSGITDLLARKVINQLGQDASSSRILWVKTLLLGAVLCVSVASQNLIPVHIAFIPILIPPLLHVMAKMNIDRRQVACVITFGLTATYMLLPVGFGGIFLNNILAKNLIDNGVPVELGQLPMAMAIHVLGMFVGLLVAVFITYRKPRQYDMDKILAAEPESVELNLNHIWVALLAIAVALGLQLMTNSIVLGALAGFVIFTCGGVIKFRESQDAFTQGVRMMSLIGFIMISAAGFAAVMKATHGVESLVQSVSAVIGDQKGLAAFLMLLVGLFITMGIGSSFSTVPIIATIYVPLCIHLGFSPMATIALVGAAGALGDAGSPASDSTLGPTSGLNADGQHDHIWDSVVPTFIHYNIPLILFGWVAAMVL
ncbi:TPA: Na+/H+ antiporter family protein [Aeromonas salmonicida subsp. salmonicida]|uniref:Na+/H+ antiporter family protein n=1 Tax=Aeromonas salmonicida TaxID=645 RepID=UPI00131FBD0F|nr:Na+/H+ antiporter family protein [Aeromonas salmonicida]ELI6419883.1 Na+/H+ antiporter family protein [Aeromonas salmonicida subsp. salmonicida]ELM3648327.1 Na+/H+ antiporter family protein [Aeromonas salmonicida subsp. salmonicida]QHE42706.1 TRAP transporter large permease subunit [Aeromonas salmonicida subsp. salmonicida]QHE48104.1 TRAP transporter large permease subunit [Aeromonas salmonicida subsp. salmonicida]